MPNGRAGEYDPRTRVVDTPDGVVVTGTRCTSCGYPIAERLTFCPACGGPCVDATFGPGAEVFAATVLRVPVPDRPAPRGLAYVDIDDGPRILAHVTTTDAALRPQSRVRLVGTTAQGDPLVQPEGAR